MVADISRGTLNKMLSGKAIGQSSSPDDHLLAVANIDDLFERAVLGWSKPDRSGDPNIAAIHRFFAPLRVGGEGRLAKITVKEFAMEADGRRIYTVESVDLDRASPAVKWVAASAEADDLHLTSTRPSGDASELAQRIEDFNAAARGQPAGGSVGAASVYEGPMDIKLKSALGVDRVVSGISPIMRTIQSPIAAVRNYAAAGLVSDATVSRVSVAVASRAAPAPAGTRMRAVALASKTNIAKRDQLAMSIEAAQPFSVF